MLAARPDEALSAVRPVDLRPVGKSSATATLDTVTIKAAEERRKLRRRINRFVFSVTVSYMFDSLPRWDEPICPLVAGLPRAQGEYVLGRITQVATAAHAPLAGEHCKANLFVVATAYPQRFLEKWWSRDLTMYNACSGLGGVKKFIHSRRPVRVWYNTMPAGPNGTGKGSSDLDAPALGLHLGPQNSACISTSSSSALALSQVYVVVDLRHVDRLDIGQLADYVALVGLAQIQLDTRPAGPSILTLFHERKDPPTGLSDWDRALLYALYDTPQSRPLVQLAEMKNTMVARIMQSHHAQ